MLWKDRWVVVKTFLRKYIWVILIVGIILINTVLAYRHFFVARPQPQTPTSTKEVLTTEPPAPEGMVASPLNGAYVKPETIAVRPVAVMIDNFTTARPASGLNAASVVWEAPVEGGVTRLLGVWQTTDDVTIGAVRSARDYFIPWVKEVDGVYIHSGGSPKALADIAADKNLDDANEFSNGGAYYRSAKHDAPHNLYTTTTRLTALITRRAMRTVANILPQPAATVPPTTGESAKEIDLPFLSSSYDVRWIYDEGTHRYRRVQGGNAVNDAITNEQIVSATIIVQFANVVPAPNAVALDAVDVTTIGSGEAWFLRDGRLVKGTWNKPTATGRTEFKLADGQAFAVARGTLWIEVVPKNKIEAAKYQ